jgi:hypothetical protein
MGEVKMDIFDVTCPKCRKIYYCDLLLFELEVRLHCPYCGHYFYRKESPQVYIGGTGTSSVAQIKGGIKPDMIYEPKEEESG